MKQYRVTYRGLLGEISQVTSFGEDLADAAIYVQENVEECDEVLKVEEV